MKTCPKCGKQFADDANFCPVDAARLTAVEAAPGAGADPMRERFELAERLGGATTGAVHKARDKQAGQTVAVKVVAAEVAALPTVAARLERELKQLERVDAPGVARVLASGKTPGAAGELTWIATEYLDGAQTLAQAIGARGPISVAMAAQLIEMIGEALIEAAKVGVVHRDLAPKNVLFAGDQIKLINFAVPTATGGDKAPGVAEYVAPECVEGKPIDQRSNIYSLGAIHYYALTGQPPIEGDVASVLKAKVEGTIPPPSTRGVALPAEVDALVKRALDRSPSKRYLTVRQYLDEVARVADGGAPSPSTTLPGGRVGKPKAAELIGTLTGLVGGGQASGPVISPASVPPTGPVIELTGGKVPSTTLPLGAMAPVVTPAVATAPVGHDGSTAILGGGVAPAAAPPVAAVPAPAPAVAAIPAAAAVPANATEPLVAASPKLATAAAILTSPAALAAAAAASGKKKDDDAGGKGKFRETMWFKKGELDVAAAEAAAEERARTGKDAATDKADSKPIDERYNDDGSLSRADRDKYSLKTGGTQMMAAIKDPRMSGSIAKVSENELIGEMKGGRRWIVGVIIGGLAVVGGLIAWAALS